MATTAIDLSGGFVPKQPAQPAGGDIDISAGLIPRTTMSSTGQGSSPDYGANTAVVDPAWKGIGKGVMREGAQLASGAYGFGRRVLDMVPGVEGSGFDQEIQQHQQTLDDAARPQNIDESFGKVGAEMGSYLLPAKAESMLTEMAPENLRFLARIGASSLSNGAMNAMNGGSFKAGAATGAAVSGVGELGRGVLAPQLVRSAIPGNSVTGKVSTDAAKAFLDEAGGVKPTVALSNTTNRIAQAANDLESNVAARPWASVPMQSAVEPVEKYLNLAKQERVPTNTNQIQELMDFLRGHGDYGPARPTVYGQPEVSPQEALDARRGLDKNFLSSAKWEKVANPDATAAAKLAYGELTRQLHFAVPGSAEADDLMSKLIPVQTGLKTLVKNDPSIVGNVAGRMAARTGALTAASVAAASSSNPVAAGLAGLVGPEVLSSPTAKLSMAYLLHSTASPVVARGVVTPVIQELLDSLRGRGK